MQTNSLMIVNPHVAWLMSLPDTMSEKYARFFSTIPLHIPKQEPISSLNMSNAAAAALFAVTRA